MEVAYLLDPIVDACSLVCRLPSAVPYSCFELHVRCQIEA